MLIDKCMNKDYLECNLFDACNILIEKCETKNSFTKKKLISKFYNIKQ